MTEKKSVDQNEAQKNESVSRNKQNEIEVNENGTNKEEVKTEEQNEEKEKQVKDINSVILKLDPKKFKAHDKNKDIYGPEKVDEGLIDSIRQHGQLEPIVVDQDLKIISGHRRWRAIKEINRREKENKDFKPLEAKYVMKSYNSEEEREEAIVEFNKQRKKNPLQIYNEAALLEPIYSERAKIRKDRNLLHYIDYSDLSNRDEDYGRTLAKLARAVNLSEGSLFNLMYVGKKYSEKNKNANTVMKDMKEGKFSIDAGYKFLRLMESADDPKAKTQGATQKDREIAVKAQEYVTKITEGTLTPNKADEEFKKYTKEYTDKPPKTRTIPPEGVYSVIVADPKNADQVNNTETKVSNDSALFLWATTQNLQDRLDLMQSWGYSLKSIAIFDTESKSDVYLNGIVEFVLFGLKGNMKPVEGYQPDIIFKKGEKDKTKYDSIYNIAEKMFPNESFVDPFNDSGHDGWGKPTFVKDTDNSEGTGKV
jgi:hypothetical protein